MRFSFLIITVFAGFCSFRAAGQDDSIKGGKGEFYIVNWSPPAGQDGPQLAEVILQYDFDIRKDLPYQRFLLRWNLGHYLVIDGVTYSPDEVGEDGFSKISIQEIKFSAKIFSGDRYVGDMVIDYPKIIPRSGGESGWYTIGSVGWDEVFRGLSGEEARRIFQQGFTLKEGHIHEIGFGDHLPEMVKKEEDTLAKPDLPGLKQIQQKRFSETSVGKIIMDSELSKKVGYEGLPWYGGFYADASYRRFPINVNSKEEVVSGTTRTIIEKSFHEVGGGYFLTAGVQGWPFFGQYFGAGCFLSASAGGVPSLFSFSSVDFGYRQFLGERELKLLFEISGSLRNGRYKESFTKTISGLQTTSSITGNLDYRLTRIGLGPMFWTGKQSLHSFDLVMLMEYLSTQGGSNRWAFGWQAGFWIPRRLRIGFTLSSIYPSTGVIEFPLTADYKPKGTLLMVSIAKPFDYFSRPVLLKRFNTVKWK